ncbi:CBS domain-containing protein [Faunimonas pinastri]|uniref:CBS domain-containing protein n=1 Tax=Faunimonas pinastri TaxID=1855383 RepID=A0A1H9PRC5_9HYPH|nr:hemolysin family protein [Faunimonas pinastri]SER50762.1 CBS domain-containing protein [Faunimonas pinastri]
MSDDPRSPDPAGDLSARIGESAPEPVTGRLRSALGSIFGLWQSGSARSEIEEAIAADEAGATSSFSPEERNMLRAILRLGDMRVADVMVPRADIECVEVEASVASVLAEFREAGHSRMPVYRETLDDPVGMVHIKDVMAWITDTAVRKPLAGEDETDPHFDLSVIDLSLPLHSTGLVRPVLFVPPSMPARLLLQRMQASRIQMALVIDEYGGTDGLVSLEDLVEIIVGEIEDEHDLDEEATIIKVSEGQFVADARASLEEAVEVIGPSFRIEDGEEHEIETLGGLVSTVLGRVPLRGEIVNAVPGFEFEILDADPRRVKRMRIRERRKPKPVRQRVRTAGDTAPQANEAGDRPANSAAQQTQAPVQADPDDFSRSGETRGDG